MANNGATQSDFRDLSPLVAAARSLGVRLREAELARLRQYGEMLLHENAHMNLTAITEPVAVQLRHFADSLSVVPLVDEYVHSIGGDVAMLSTVRLFDIGTGGGFPGLPIALVRPRLAVTLVDATAKKVAFLRHVADVLGATNVTALALRAEEAGHDPTLRGAADIVTARAVARLAVLAEYCLPLLRPGGWMIALKSGDLADELAEGERAFAALGGTLREVRPVPLAELPGHVLVRVEKTGDTPAVYPRRPGVPAKKPLGT